MNRIDPYELTDKQIVAVAAMLGRDAAEGHALSKLERALVDAFEREATRIVAADALLAAEKRGT